MSEKQVKESQSVLGPFSSPRQGKGRDNYNEAIWF